MRVHVTQLSPRNCEDCGRVESLTYQIDISFGPKTFTFVTCASCYTRLIHRMLSGGADGI
jgi:hypothetical protein